MKLLFHQFVGNERNQTAPLFEGVTNKVEARVKVVVMYVSHELLGIAHEQRLDT